MVDFPIEDQRKLSEVRVEALKEIQKLGMETSFGADQDLVQKSLITEFPISDTDLNGPNLDSPNLEEEKVHKPSIEAPVHASGENCSWNHRFSKFIKDEWGKAQRTIADAVTHFHPIKSLEVIKDLKEYAAKLANTHINEFGNEIRQSLPDFLKKPDGNLIENWRDYLIVTKSGADAIIAAMDLTESGNENVVSTDENGSGVIAALDKIRQLKNKKFEKIALRDSQGELRSKVDLVRDWSDAIDAGARFLSVTLVSKTGEIYDDVVKEVAAIVADHNKENPTDKIVMVVDAVQMMGRDEMTNIFKWLNEEGVMFVTHSGSKAAGGIPHAGFLWSNQEGKDYIKDSAIDKATTAHEIVASPGLKNEEKQKNHLWTAFRAADNARACTKVAKLDKKDSLYGERAIALMAVYEKFFQYMGCTMKKRRKAVVSILAMSPPKGVSAENANTKFLTRLAQLSVAMGGYLKEKNTVFAILRWGLSLELLEDNMSKDTLWKLLFGDLTEDQVDNAIKDTQDPEGELPQEQRDSFIDNQIKTLRGRWESFKLKPDCLAKSFAEAALFAQN